MQQTLQGDADKVVIAGQPAPAVKPDQPQGEELLAGKYKTVEDLVAGYKELETKLGGVQQNQDDPSKKVGTTDTAPQEGTFVVAGQDVAAFAKEYEEKGALSPESYKALADAGFPKELVDAYIAGQEARVAVAQTTADRDIQEIKAAVGGAEAFDKMVTWAETALTDEEIDKYNEATGSGDKAKALKAVEGLRDRYKEAVGEEPNLVTTGGQVSGADVFKSMDEVRRAMADPRYRTDKAYNRAVVEKLSRSNI